MVSRWAKVLSADALLLLIAYLIIGDVQWRSSFAVMNGLVPSFSYLPFIQFFMLTGRAFPLQSPPTLDWLQIILVAAVLANLWYSYGIFGGKRPKVPSNPAPTVQLRPGETAPK